jgi:hypothetical protein
MTIVTFVKKGCAVTISKYETALNVRSLEAVSMLLEHRREFVLPERDLLRLESVLISRETPDLLIRVFASSPAVRALLYSYGRRYSGQSPARRGLEGQLTSTFPLREFKWKVHIYKGLESPRAKKILVLAQLQSCTPEALLVLPHIGVRGVAEIEATLDYYGLRLATSR